MILEKPTGTIRTAYDLDNEPYLFEATGAEAKRFVDILNADDDGRLIVLPCKVERVAEVALINVLLEYFDVGNSYTYELMRSKTAFSAGTMSMDDFQEWGDDDVFKLANYIVGHFCEEAKKAEKALEGMG